jgi:hypothetical protein
MKGMNAFNMVRMGVARAKSARIYSSPLFGVDYEMKSYRELEVMHGRMMDLLGQGAVGVYPWLMETVGEERAFELAKQESIPYDVGPTRGRMGTAGRVRGRSDVSNSDDDIDIFGVGGIIRHKRSRL